MNDDARWMGSALALAARGRGRTAPNPAVGCVIVKDGHVIGRGWTQPGGRPHAEAGALAQAGDLARGATAYVTLEPCAHVSTRGPACADLLIAAGVARVVIAATDPDPRTAGAGAARIEAAGIAVTSGVRAAEAAAQNPGFFSRMARGRPFVTLKLALSLDGCLALNDGRSRWITGAAARAHAHRERALADLIVVGRGTLEADDPALDVRLAGLEDRAPRAAVLSRSLNDLPPSKLATTGATLPISMPMRRCSTCSSKAVRGWRPNCSPPTASTGCSSTAPPSSSAASPASAISACPIWPTRTVVGFPPASPNSPPTAQRFTCARRSARFARMFTGIITDIGTVESATQRADLRVVITSGYDMAGVAIGASIACSGVCLTVVEKGAGWFAVDASHETLSKSAPGHFVAGAKLNLERALKVGDELGGHIVTGHVDAVATVARRWTDGGSIGFEFAAPRIQGACIAAKGSITIDGVSLTVNAVHDTPEATLFTVNIIPHTAKWTTLGALAVGDSVNIEIDVLARYLERMRESLAN